MYELSCRPAAALSALAAVLFSHPILLASLSPRFRPPLVMRRAALLGHRYIQVRQTSLLLPFVYQPARLAHASTQPAQSSTLTPHPSSTSTVPTQDLSPDSSSSTLFPPGSPVIISPPSHFHLSPSEQAERDASVAQHLHRQRRLQAAFDNTDGSHLRLSFDLAFTNTSRQAATSLMTQLRHVAHTNRTSDYPACLHINALDPRALTAEAASTADDSGVMKRKEGEQKAEDSEAAAAEQLVREMQLRWSDNWLMHRTTASVASSFPSHELVYLSPDAHYILWRVDPQLVYVVGGLVDKQNIVRKVSLRVADALQVRSARLPIRECIPGGLRKSALNVDAVFALLMHVHQAAQRIRHNRPHTATVTAASSHHSTRTPSASRDVEAVYGLQYYPRRRSLHAYKRPVFGASEQDEGIDWFRLWSEAFDAVIPPRLRWSADDVRAQKR